MQYKYMYIFFKLIIIRLDILIIIIIYFLFNEIIENYVLKNHVFYMDRKKMEISHFEEVWYLKIFIIRCSYCHKISFKEMAIVPFTICVLVSRQQVSARAGFWTSGW